MNFWNKLFGGKTTPKDVITKTESKQVIAAPPNAKIANEAASDKTTVSKATKKTTKNRDEAVGILFDEALPSQAKFTEDELKKALQNSPADQSEERVLRVSSVEELREAITAKLSIWESEQPITEFIVSYGGSFICFRTNSPTPPHLIREVGGIQFGAIKWRQIDIWPTHGGYCALSGHRWPSLKASTAVSEPDTLPFEPGWDAKFRLRENVTVYSNPNSNTPVLAELKSGDEINVRSGNGNWNAVNLSDGRAGYISAKTKADRV